MGQFKRNVYFKLRDMLHNNNVIFLLGPRKCGKTVALKQINIDNNKAEYIDFKKLSSKDSMKTVNEIAKSISLGEDKVYLLDEMTYAFYPEPEIAKIAEVYADAIALGIDTKTKVIFSGSQSVALEAWGRRAFCNQAQFVYLDFLSYPEWLRYKQRQDVTAESYEDFVKGTSEFYHFTTVKDYLGGCLEETVISNTNTQNIIWGNSCDQVDADQLVDILYLTLFSLHDISSAQTMFKNDALADKIAYLSHQMESKNPLSLTEVRERISKSFLNKYNSVKAIDVHTLKQSFAFLIHCGLITATPVFSDMDQESSDVLQNLQGYKDVYYKKDDLLGKVNFTINYPMFFVEILKEILKDDFSDKISGFLMGSIVECHARGLLPKHDAFEYHDEHDREIDYVNRAEGIVVEITVSNKHLKNTHLDLIPQDMGYKKILLTKDVHAEQGDIQKIPYYEFIYQLSGGEPQQDKVLSTEINDSAIEDYDDL